MALWSLSLTLPAGLENDKAGSLAFAPLDDSGDDMAGFSPAPLAGTSAREGQDHRGAWILEWLFDATPDAQALCIFLKDAARRLGIDGMPDALIAKELPDDDWLERSYRAFEPFVESGFYIYGSHVEHPAPGDHIPLQIDAATAFGSGEHGTTAGCLQLLRDLRNAGAKPARILDLGTGSGILAVAAWKLWGVPVLATDIDEEAVRVAMRYRDANGVAADQIICARSDGFDAAELQDGQPFDLIIANILAGPLRVMHAPMVERAAKDSSIILSGMLEEQAQSVTDLYCAAGCRIAQTVLRNGWASVRLEKF